MATTAASPKTFLKNLRPGGTFPTLGNDGSLFPWNQPNIPDALQTSCPLSIEENREVYVLTQDGRIIYINCPSSF